MQEAIPYRTYLHPAAVNTNGNGGTTRGVQLVIANTRNAKQMVEENSVIVFGKRGCCMCHVVKTLLLGLGVNPAIFEFDEQIEAVVVDQLSNLNSAEGGNNKDEIQFPVVFVRGKLFGGLDRLMVAHISDELIPILKDAGVLWL